MGVHSPAAMTRDISYSANAYTRTYTISLLLSIFLHCTSLWIILTLNEFIHSQYYSFSIEMQDIIV